MALRGKFKGFSQAGLDFYAQLARHNRREWFAEHKEVYEREVLEPARALVDDLGRSLAKVAPGLHAEPKVNRSIFRIQRDIRFSADKSPFKTHLGLWLWEGEGPRMECSGFYFQMEPPRIMVAAGMYVFPRRLLGPFRQAVADDKLGPALTRALQPGLSQGLYDLGGRHYARVPRGLDPGHPRADLLRHNGLYVFHESGFIEELHSPALVEWCRERYAAMVPMHRWLRELCQSHLPEIEPGPWPDL